MAESPNQTDSIFPVLDAAQVEHLASFSRPRCARQREILFDHGDERHGVFIVVKGRHRNPRRTKDQALGICQSERRRAEDAIEERPFSSYLRVEYLTLLSPSEAGWILLFMFLTPVLAYYCLLAVEWAGVKAGRLITRGFAGPGHGPLR